MKQTTSTPYQNSGSRPQIIAEDHGEDGSNRYDFDTREILMMHKQAKVIELKVLKDPENFRKSVIENIERKSST